MRKEQYSKERLRTFLQDDGLYHPLELEYKQVLHGIEFSNAAEQMWPHALSLACRTCNAQACTTHLLRDQTTLKLDTRHVFLRFQCALCLGDDVAFALKVHVISPPDRHAGIGGLLNRVVTAFRVEKVGQDPGRSIAPQHELKKLLPQEELDLLKKALISIEHGFGVGALAYMRRVIEDSTALLLDMLRQSAELDSDQASVDKIDAASKAFSATDRLKLAANVLPAYLRPGGLNPLDQLYRLFSEGIHSGPDDEALANAKAARQMFELVMLRVRQHIEDAKSTQATLVALAKHTKKK